MLSILNCQTFCRLVVDHAKPSVNTVLDLFKFKVFAEEQFKGRNND